MTDWKAEHDAELGLRQEWSARAQKAEAEIERLRAALEDTTYPLGEIDGLMAERDRLREDNRKLALIAGAAKDLIENIRERGLNDNWKDTANALRAYEQGASEK
jgi:hypothetical protein